jgi:uncharacterized protein (UPF0332 family)
MSLKQLQDQNRLSPHKTSAQEIKSLLMLVDRDLKDAKIEQLSEDRRFATAYNAALQLATILLYCNNYKTRGAGHHFTIFQSLKYTLGREYFELSDYFDSCRTKRNVGDYMSTGVVSKAEVNELMREVEGFKKIVLKWLKANKPGYK